MEDDREDVPGDCPYPPTYHTPRAEATYEQCPWDRAHIEALYARLRGGAVLVEDGAWRDYPMRSGVGRYRVRGGYFQAVFAGEANPVFERLAAMEPVETDDDAEWQVWHLDEPDGSVWYALSSTFATTPGPFAHQAPADDLLFRHGLGLEMNERFAEGVAYFEEIEAGCMADAVGRLHWLECALGELNGRLERAGARFWRRFGEHSGALAEAGRGAAEGEEEEDREIVPLPAWYPDTGRRRREPLPDPPAPASAADGAEATAP